MTTVRFGAVPGKQQELKFLIRQRLTGYHTSVAPDDAVAVEVEYLETPDGASTIIDVTAIRWEHADGSWTLGEP